MSTTMNQQPEKKKRVKKVIPSCDICVEPYNKSTRLLVKCPYCNYETCRTCCETYILNETEVKCMNPECAKVWTRKHIREIFTLVFINGPLKEHKEKVLFDKERALLPATQPIIEGKLLARKIDKEMLVLQRQISEINKQQRKLLQDKHAALNRKTSTDRTAFVRACPQEDCRGFLSSQWKCGICERWTCPDCHVLKGYTRDSVHTCNADDLATAKLISSDTKPCPQCGTGIFKIDGCFTENTPILLFDGSIKMSQDISVGDILIGDDGLQRTVLDTTNGVDEMFEVIQNKAVKYVVNSKHTLVLRYSGDKTITWHETTNLWKVIWFDRKTRKQRTLNFKISDFESKETAFIAATKFKDTLLFDNTIEITVEEYMNLDNTVKRNLMGYKSSGVKYEQNDVELDPYMLGIWLGDGIHSRPEIATNDEEILKYIKDWCDSNDSVFVYEKNNKYKIRISQNPNSVNKKENHLSKQLRNYNLLNNKHIPSVYLMNSREVRLKLLAGLIDTDGSVSCGGKRVTIVQTRDELSRQIIYLARTLGFIVNFSIRERKQCVIFGCEPKDYKNQYVINISGELLSEIPTLVQRKKCNNAHPNKDNLRTSIQVNPVGQGKYYGWEIDGNHRFILPDFTVVRNCDQMWCTECHTAFSWRTGRKEQNIHNPHYYEWQRRNGGGQAPRNPGDVPCGRNLDHYLSDRFHRLLRTYYTTAPNYAPILTRVQRIIRWAIHLINVERPNPPNYEQKNENLRVQYLMKEITEQQMRDELQRDDKKHHKNQELAEVFTLLVNTVTDILYRFLDYLEQNKEKAVGNSVDIDVSILTEIDRIVDYANECLGDISHTYSCSRFYIEYDLSILKGQRALEFIRALKKNEKATDDKASVNATEKAPTNSFIDSNNES